LRVAYAPYVRHQLRFLLPAVSGLLAIALVLVIVLGRTHGGNAGSPAGQAGAFDGAAFPGGVRAHDFTLTDQQGRKLSLSSYRGQVVVLAFLSPDCRTCVLIAQQVRGALDELGSTAGVRAIFVSTQTGALRARAGRLLAETSLTGRVEYLTGTAKELRPVWRAYAIAPASAGKAAAEAGVTVLLIDRKGIERVGFGLEQITPEGLAHDIRLLRGA
jgi:protein SCO1